MADLIELVFAEDNETLLRKDDHQIIDVRTIGRPQIKWYDSCTGHLMSCGGSREHKIIAIQDRRANGADAYVVGNESTLDKYGSTYYQFSVQYYKIISGGNDE